ncbi:hypothetical protein [Nitratireductor basaltis]|uniref:Chemotaxis protein n=1 Tax=Nitratireductor basaltis TaxID=472175 RepID=A0A084U894_9HYPH|nr:hypothetical protein [Nitratireductor basaltis]KFB09180.1 Chemotaxis protein [Nitratireductor basaltis]
MPQRAGRIAAIIGTVGLAALAASLPVKAAGLEPYQMMRSLQVVQDRIADGDHAALPMQTKLLNIIDARLRDAPREAYDDARNLNALLAYASSGGNPATIREVFATLSLEGDLRTIGDGLLSYALGDPNRARAALGGVNPLDLPNAVGAPLGLVAGSLLMRDTPQRALELFDQTRLMAPGTLLEEAALRRTLDATAILGDAERFARAARQYVSRFIHSPYASQFAESLVAGIVAMRDRIDLEEVAQIADRMSNEQARVIYLRIARQAAIDGHEGLLAFASEQAEKKPSDPGKPQPQDPRAILYESAASVTKENVNEVLATLQSIDEKRLSASDKELLRAAKAIARSVIEPPVITVEASMAPQPAQMDENDEASLVPASATAPTAPDAEGTYLQDARKKLEAIDRLLEEKR